MSWYAYPNRNDAVNPQPDTGIANWGLCQFFTPRNLKIQIPAYQSKRIPSGWVTKFFPSGYALRTYTGSQIQRLGLMVIPQLIGLNGTQTTAKVRNLTNHPVTLRGGMHFMSTLLNTLSHDQPILQGNPNLNSAIFNCK